MELTCPMRTQPKCKPYFNGLHQGLHWVRGFGVQCAGVGVGSARVLHEIPTCFYRLSKIIVLGCIPMLTPTANPLVFWCNMGLTSIIILIAFVYLTFSQLVFITFPNILHQLVEFLLLNHLCGQQRSSKASLHLIKIQNIRKLSLPSRAS